MWYQWFVILPPLIVVTIVALTRRIVPALIIGSVIAALISKQGDAFEAGATLIQRFMTATELKKLTSPEAFWSSFYLFICIFLIVLGIFIILLRQSGAAYAYGTFINKYLKTPIMAQCSSLCLSLFFFIDDYFSSLTVGSVMQPLTDRYKIPRVKLACLVNTLAAPLAILVPLTSWVAEIIGQMRNSGVGPSDALGIVVIGDPFMVYVRIIPFLFYAILVIVAIWFFIIKNYSFGIFNKHERVAAQTGNLFGGNPPVRNYQTGIPAERYNNGRLSDFMVPLASLFIFVFVGMLYTGHAAFFGGNNDMITALQSANTALSLMVGACCAVLWSFLFLFYRKRILMEEVPGIIKEGFGLMGSSILTLVLIWTFSGLISQELKTGQYLAQFFMGAVSPAWLPVMFFGVATVVSVMMGSAWGTIGMLFPLAIPLIASLIAGNPPFLIHDLIMLYPVLGAIVSGAVVGNHLSPISDVMLMSAASAGAYHMDLYKAQVTFSIQTIIATAIGYGIVGWMLAGGYAVGTSVGVALGAGLLLNLLLLALRNWIARL